MFKILLSIKLFFVNPIILYDYYTHFLEQKLKKLALTKLPINNNFCERFSIIIIFVISILRFSDITAGKCFF